MRGNPFQHPHFMQQKQNEKQQAQWYNYVFDNSTTSNAGALHMTNNNMRATNM
jgi:hypothetical protein